MDISKLKDKLGDETFAELERHIGDLTGQRDTARTESINGRKGKDKQIQELTQRLADVAEWAGVEPDADLSALPAPKGQAEAASQFEAKLKRAERERDEARQAAETASGKYRGSLQRAAVAEALGGHESVARDAVETYIGQRLVWEGEDLMFKTDAGSLVSVKDGVAGVAKARPELLKPSGTGGAGVRQPNAGGGGERKMTRAEFEAAPAAARMAHVKAGGQVVDS